MEWPQRIQAEKNKNEKFSDREIKLYPVTINNHIVFKTSDTNIVKLSKRK